MRPPSRRGFMRHSRPLARLARFWVRQGQVTKAEEERRTFGTALQAHPRIVKVVEADSGVVLTGIFLKMLFLKRTPGEEQRTPPILQRTPPNLQRTPAKSQRTPPERQRTPFGDLSMSIPTTYCFLRIS
jgi:hypothetical protein